MTLRQTQFRRQNFKQLFAFSENIDDKNNIKVPPSQITVHQTEGTAYFEVDEIKGAKGGALLYALMFTCVPCGHRMTRTFTQNAYHKGVVVIRCEKCDNNHLIADNLGWFEDNKWNVVQNAQAQTITSPEIRTVLEQFLNQKDKQDKQDK